MGTLLLKFAAPLQSWGCESRFNDRKTRHEPTKSGVIGLLAAALGRRREDSITDLAGCSVFVRVDQAGRYERDFQTARRRIYDAKTERWIPNMRDKAAMPLSNRYYLSDAVFVVSVGVPDDKVGEYAYALTHPTFPLYLGRRSCPPADKILVKAVKGMDPLDVIRNHPWEATDERLLREYRYAREVPCTLVRSAMPGDEGFVRESVRDVPLSFSQLNRQYGWRTVVYEQIMVNKQSACTMVYDGHDPMAMLEETI